MALKINWTPEKKEAVIQALERWMHKHDCWGGEMLMQDDDCQCEAPELLSDIIDDIIKPEIIQELI